MDPRHALLLRLLGPRVPAAAEIGLTGEAQGLAEALRQRHPDARLHPAPGPEALAVAGARNLDLLLHAGPADPAALYARLRGGGVLLWAPPVGAPLDAAALTPFEGAGFAVERLAQGRGGLDLRGALRRALGRGPGPCAARLRRWAGTGEH
jgi:hypothetical protein